MCYIEEFMLKDYIIAKKLNNVEKMLKNYNILLV